MSSPMKIVLDVLASLGELEWARCVGGTEPLRPPFVAWRFRHPDDGTNEKIVNATRSYVGLVEWVADKEKRNLNWNWVIQPAMLRAHAKNFRTDGEALQHFAAEYRSETHAALDDIAAFAEHLRERLSIQ